MSNFDNIREIKAQQSINDYNEFARGGNMAGFKLGNEMPCQIFLVDVNGGTAQVETNTVVAAAGITSDGNAKSVVTCAAMENSPKTVLVPVNTVDHTTAALIAAAFRAALAADENVSKVFEVSGTGADIILTKKRREANDATLNFTVEDDTSAGITEDVASADTTAGVAATGTHELATNFTRVLGGFAYSLVMDEPVEAVQVIPYATGDGSTAQVKNLPGENDLQIVIYGQN